MSTDPRLEDKTDLVNHDSENFDLKNFFRLSAGTLSSLFGGFWIWASILAFSFDFASILILVSGSILPSVGGLLLLLDMLQNPK